MAIYVSTEVNIYFCLVPSFVMKARAFFLIPCKFLTLLAHLTILIISLHGKDALIRGSLHPDEEDEDEYSQLNTSYLVGLILAISMVAIEMAIFLSGLTLFMSLLSTIEMIFHLSGTIMLAICVIEACHIDTFWWIFSLGNVVPFSLEIIASVKHIVRNI